MMSSEEYSKNYLCSIIRSLLTHLQALNLYYDALVTSKLYLLGHHDDIVVISERME